NNSYQKLEIDFYEKDGELFGLQIMDEWHPTFGEFNVPVTVDSTGIIKFGTGYGMANLNLDKNNLEIFGQLEGFNPSIYVHLKKIARKPAPDYKVEEISVSNSDITLAGHLHIPKAFEHKTAIILVGGRGCYADNTKYNLYAKFLRAYGVTVLAYQKRGNGDSTGDCSRATIGELAGDVVQMKDYLMKHPNGYKNVGVLGISAGGWTMVRAGEQTDFDFMISIVGPSTSVRDQQFQSAKYGAEIYKLSDSAKNNLKEYTRLMFEAESTPEGFENMMAILNRSVEEGWREILDDTDIPESIEAIEDLWVRRHDFDPKTALSNYKKPFLGIYGDRDWIVPYKENIQSLNSYFSERPDLLNTVVAYNAEHGMETESKAVDLGDNQSYWHFYRISPHVRIEIIKFLTKYNFID
ncbi:MAG: alpha/beta hydrolase, partial [Bacteroidia bacterium]|nr:alpha/beta hydrolase [Bacteroidia bacterium]